MFDRGDRREQERSNPSKRLCEAQNMKLCPVCKDSVLRNRHKYHQDGYGFEMFIYELYECDKGYGVCLVKYLYCVLCDEVIHYTYKYDHEHKKHKKHFIYPTLESYYSRNFDFSECRWSLSTQTIVGNSLKNRTYLSLLAFDNIKPPEELMDIINRGRFASTDPFLITSLTEAFILNNNHSCIFCGEDYETLPSEKIVYTHLKTCRVIVAMREANKPTA